MTDFKKQGKKNRASGAAFERKVRKDLESKGWIVDKWSNNVSEVYEQDVGEYVRQLEPAKHKFRGPGIPMVMGTGFPDFVCFRYRPLLFIDLPKKEVEKIKNLEEFRQFTYKRIIEKRKSFAIVNFTNKKNRKKGYDTEYYFDKPSYEIIGVEVKSNGYITKEEKEKCNWYLKNNIFSKILVASKGEKRGEIVYKEFEK